MKPTPTGEPAHWVINTLGDFAHGVTSVVPRDYEVYLRVFHPFRMNDNTTRSWREIAERVGREPHPLMQIDRLLSGFDHDDYYDHAPLDGQVPGDIAQVLTGRLRAHTSTPDRCFHAFWTGFGGMPAIAPTFDIPGRTMRLYEGTIDDAEQGIVLDDKAVRTTYRPNIWWPEDRAWCVATEIDFPCTYVGCTRTAADDLQARSLEIAEVRPDDPVTFDSGPVYR